VVTQNAHYTTSDTDLSNARRALRGLLKELEQPWSALDTGELERYVDHRVQPEERLDSTRRSYMAVAHNLTLSSLRRRTTLVGDLDDVIQMFARSVGVELTVFGVWEDAGSINSLELVLNSWVVSVHAHSYYQTHIRSRQDLPGYKRMSNHTRRFHHTRAGIHWYGIELLPGIYDPLTLLQVATFLFHQVR
jgi:hypothetical protein